jgi:hypothetical protein
MGNPKGVERDFEQLERRRLKAARLFDRGFHQGEVALHDLLPFVSWGGCRL